MNLELKLAGAFGFGVLGLIFLSLSKLQPWLFALQWFAQASLLWAWAWHATWKRRELNRLNVSAPLLQNLGWANRLTLLRGYLIALTGGFLFQPQAEGFIACLPGLFYGVAAMLDRIDGFVARITKQTTVLGTELDTVFDAFGLLVAPLLALWIGKIHWSYLLLSFAFYIFQFGLRWRTKRGLVNYPILPSRLRRALAGFQMGFIAFVLFPCFEAPQTIVCSLAFMIPVLLGFVVDWFVATGRIDAQSQRFFTLLADFSAAFFQPFVRVFLAVGLFFIVRTIDFSLFSSVAKILYLSGFVLGLALVLLGWAGRVGALIILLLLSAYALPINVLLIAVLCSAVFLLLLGTGRFSLWQGDDVWVNRQDGASAES
jgi:CDP-diacylglycerol--glycerol-3-phosphate 3-phosphatidyltransferase